MAPGLRALKGVVAEITQHPGDELRKPKAKQRTTLCSVVVPLSISWHGIKHKMAKNYRTHDHKQPEKRPTGAYCSRPRESEKHILAKQHEIKQFVAKKISWNLRHFLPFSALGGMRHHSRRSADEQCSRFSALQTLGTDDSGTLPLASQVTKGGLNGLMLRTPVDLKSSVLRVTTVRSYMRAMGAICLSMGC